MKENKYFPYLVAISAISISFSAAFYSIFGIGKMFAGASTNVMVMAASLEFAKLVIASLLYRFWDDINKALKLYLTIACFILIVITSAGIYGFLSSAYQETANKVENIDKNTAVIEKRKQMLQRQLDQAEKQLELKSNRQNTLSDMRNRQQSNADNLISQNKSISAVRSQMNQLSKESKTLDDDIKVLQDTIASKTQQINDLDLEILDLSSNNDIANEIGPLKYIAKITGKTLDQVVNWFIIALMLVFDPLAIALVVAANFVFSYTNKKKEEEKNKVKESDEKQEKKSVQEVPQKENTPEETLPKIETVQEQKILEEENLIVEENPAPVENQILEENSIKGFVIGNTPVAEINQEENEVSDNFNNEDEEDLVYSPDPSTIPQTLTPEEASVIVEDYTEENEEIIGEENPVDSEEGEGEFKGYRLGNVYKKIKKSIKDYQNKKDIPIDLLVRKDDPTRL